MKKIYNPAKNDWSKILKRPTLTVEDIEPTVYEIFKEVKIKGDNAIAKYTNFFDGIRLTNPLVSDLEMEEAIKAVPSGLKEAIKLAKTNITKFHKAQITHKVAVETSKGVECWQEKRPIQKIGIYIPGGTAPLFSTVLMLAIPANIAGCKEIVLCTPPNKEGNVNAAILYAAQLCGVTKIIKVGWHSGNSRNDIWHKKYSESI